MLIGNVGIISAIASLMLTFIQNDGNIVSDWVKILIILGSIGLLYLLSRSNWLERILVRLIKAGLKKFTDLNIKDYVEMLNLTGEFEITVIQVKKGDWLENKKLKDLKLHQEGVNLIAIQRDDGDYVGTPGGSTKIFAKDRLILYGREKNLKNLEKRRKNLEGDQEHEKAKAEQQEKRRQEEEKEKQRLNDKRKNNPK